MAKFRKKPVVIEAVQFWPDMRPYPEGVDVLVAGPYHPAVERGEMEVGDFDLATIKTLEGTMEVKPGDWVITGVAGEKYPCKPEIFEATYEPAEESA